MPTAEQARAALEFANGRRFRRAELKRRLRTREIAFCEVDFENPDLQGMTLDQILGAMPWRVTASGTRHFRVGRRHQYDLLTFHGFSPRTRVEALSQERRDLLVAVVMAGVPSQRELVA